LPPHSPEAPPLRDDTRVAQVTFFFPVKATERMQHFSWVEAPPRLARAPQRAGRALTTDAAPEFGVARTRCRLRSARDRVLARTIVIYIHCALRRELFRLAQEFATSINVGMSRRAATRALNAGQACGGPSHITCCLVGNPHRLSTGPGAPSRRSL
jgi:hypothetical protein